MILVYLRRVRAVPDYVASCKWIAVTGFVEIVLERFHGFMESRENGKDFTIRSVLSTPLS